MAVTKIRDRDWQSWVDLPCPVCGAEAGKECRYQIGAEHNGWVHVGRVTAARNLPATPNT